METKEFVLASLVYRFSPFVEDGLFHLSLLPVVSENFSIANRTLTNRVTAFVWKYSEAVNGTSESAKIP